MQLEAYRGIKMPTFPSFQRRLAELNNPMQRAAADTPMEIGGIPRPRNIVSPMKRQQPKRTLPPGVGEFGPEDVQPMHGQLDMDTSMIRPQGASGEIPLVQSGTEPAALNKPTTGIIQRKVAQDAGMDLSPGLEEIPSTPTFAPKEVKGVWGRIKSAFQAAGGASRMYPDRPLAPLVGAIAGGIDPRIAQVMHYQGVVLPEAYRQQQAVMGRNDARMKSLDLELRNRERLAKIKEIEQPDYVPLAGGEYPLLYNKRNPSQTVIPTGPDGKPLRNAGVVNTETRAESAEEVARQRDVARAERDVARAESDMLKKKYEFDEKRKAAERAAQDKLDLEKFRQGQQNIRAGNAQTGATARNNARIRARRGDEGDGEASATETQPAASQRRQRNVFDVVPEFDSPFSWKSKTPGLPAPSGTSPVSGGKKRQLPPPSGTGN